MAYYTLCFLGDLKEVRGEQFYSFYNDCVFMDRCWMALGLSVKTSREFMLNIYGQKLHFVSLFLLRFPLLLLKTIVFAHFFVACFVSKQVEETFFFDINFAEIPEIILPFWFLCN